MSCAGRRTWWTAGTLRLRSRWASSSQDITGLHPFRDTFLISKTNGLWVWSQNGTVNDFVNVTSEWENAPGLERGIVGAEWHRDLFLSWLEQHVPAL